MTFAQQQNRLTTHFSERIPIIKRRMTVLGVIRHFHEIWCKNSSLKDIKQA